MGKPVSTDRVEICTLIDELKRNIDSEQMRRENIIKNIERRTSKNESEQRSLAQRELESINNTIQMYKGNETESLVVFSYFGH